MLRHRSLFLKHNKDICRLATRASAEIFPGGETSTLFRLPSMQCKWMFTKRLHFLHHKENAQCYGNSHKKCASLAAIARYVTIISTIGYLQIFKTGSFHRRIAMFFNPTINYDFSLPSKTCQRHLETRAANVSDLVQSHQSPFQKEPCLSLVSFQFFHRERSSYINRTSTVVRYVDTTIGLTKLSMQELNQLFGTKMVTSGFLKIFYS